MKRLFFIILLLPALAFAQFGHGGSGTGNGVSTVADTTGNPTQGYIYFSLADSNYYTWGAGDYWSPLSDISASTMLGIIADSSKWTAGSTTNRIKPRDAKSLEADSIKAAYLNVTGNMQLDGNLAMVTTAAESLVIQAGGIRNEAGFRQKGAAVFGATPTQATIATTGKITTPDSVAATLGIRTEGTLRAKGIATFGATTTPIVLSTAGKVTATDSIAAGKGIRSEGPALIKGDVTARTKIVISDSLRTNLTSKLIGDVQVGTGSAWYAAEDSLVVTSGATQNVRTRSMIDTGEYQLPAGVEGFGKVKIGAEYADFWFESDGTVTLVTNTTNVSTTNDADGKLNIYDNGSNIVIENQLGSTLKCLIHITYMTP